MYPPLSIPIQVPRSSARVGTDDPARQPTDSKPGSPGKIAVLTLRAKDELPLWLAGDATFADVLDGRSGFRLNRVGNLSTVVGAVLHEGADGLETVEQVEPPPAQRRRSLRERIQGVLQRDRESARKRSARAAKGGRG